MDSVALTGAELAFLLSGVDESRQRRAWSRLHLADDVCGEASLRAGLSSLAARGLATGNGADILLSPPVTAIRNGLTAPVVWVELSAFTREAADLAQLYVHDHGAFLLSPRAYTTFEIQGVRPGVSPVELLVSLARHFLTERAPALVACRGDAPGSEVAVAALAGGTYSFSGSAGVALPAATLDDALRLFASALVPVAAVA